MKLFIVASMIFITLPALAFTQYMDANAHKISIGPRATYSSPRDADEGQWHVGAQGRLYLSQNMGLEGSIDYRSNNYFTLTNIKSYPIQMSLLFYPVPNAPFNPFLIGGIGWYYTQVNGPFGFNSTYNRFSLHTGAGIELMFNETLVLDGSYRYIWLDNVTTRDANSLDRTLQDSGSMITIGLNFLF